MSESNELQPKLVAVSNDTVPKYEYRYYRWFRYVMLQ